MPRLAFFNGVNLQTAPMIATRKGRLSVHPTLAERFLELINQFYSTPLSECRHRCHDGNGHAQVSHCDVPDFQPIPNCQPAAPLESTEQTNGVGPVRTRSDQGRVFAGRGGSMSPKTWRTRPGSAAQVPTRPMWRASTERHLRTGPAYPKQTCLGDHHSVITIPARSPASRTSRRNDESLAPVR